MASDDDAPEVGNGAPDAPPGPPSESPPLAPRPRARLGRAALWIGGGSLVFAGVTTGALAWLLGHLAHPWVKPRIQALAREHANLDVDYDDLTVSLDDGVRARGLRLLQPLKFRAVAQDFLRVDALELRMQPLEVALSGGKIAAEAVRVEGVDATVITDASGATTLSELFPSKPEREPAPSRTSASLAELPYVDVPRVEVARVQARMIELRDGASRRTTSLAALGLRGAVHTAPNDLTGTRLTLTSDPALRIAQREGDDAKHAELRFALDLSADAPRSLRVRLASTLQEQDLVPSWSGGDALATVDAMVTFEPDAARTLVAIEQARIAGELLGAEARVELHDGPPMRVIASGKLRAAMQKLPLALEGYAVDALALNVDAERLSWDGARVAGALAWTGSASGLALDDGTQQVQLSGLNTRGKGSFDDPDGQLQGDVKLATLALRAPVGSAQVRDLSVTLDGRTTTRSGTQALDAQQVLTLGTVALSTVAKQTVALRGARVDARVAGTVPDLQREHVQKLNATLAIDAVDVTDASMRATLEKPAAQLGVVGLAPSDASPSGYIGDALAKITVPSLRVVQAGAPLSARETSLSVALPLSLATANGTLALGQLLTPDARVERTSAEITAREPLGFSGEDGRGSLRVDGKVGALRAGSHRASLETLGITAERTSSSRYQATLDTSASSLVLADKPVPERITAQLRADADRAAGTLVASAALHGPRGAAVTSNVDATFTRASGRLRYDAALGAEKLDAFAALLADVAAGTKVEGARVHAAAKGDLTGVLRGTADGLVEPMPDPLTSARGTQTVALTMEGLDHRGADGALAVPSLRLSVESTHREGGAGTANLALKTEALHLDSSAGSVHLRDLDQRIHASFPRSPSQGLMDVRASTKLGGATQSYFPAYRVSDLTLDAHVQVDHLRSFFLRQLDLVNADAGTSLHAKGAIELRTRSAGGSGGDGERTLVGREALALEGKLEQELAPFQKLGFAARASGTLRVPFRLESGGLLDYRLLAAIEAQRLSLVTSDRGLGVEELTGLIPIVEEFALLPSGAVVSAGPRESPLTEARFFDVHPFLGGNDYVTARTITLRGLPPFGPFAANMRLDRESFLIDQLQMGWNDGQIVGQVRLAWRDGDPLVRMRLNATGVRAGASQDVLDANAALTYQPRVSTLDGKVQLVRVSPAHLLGILDVVDPFHENTSTNRVRQALKLGYPKFVRFLLHDGALDTKVELGGVAKVVRIDEIKAVPLGPILQRYVVPTLSGYLEPAPAEPGEVAAARPEESP